ncbi:MAG: GTPase [archaeon]
MPINVNDPEYVSAEKEYHDADSLEKRLAALKKMISHAPKHKGGENLRQQLTTRRKKLEQEIIKKAKSGKSTFKGIKKQEHQVVIIGQTNSGKSSLLNNLTNANPKISEIPFTNKEPIIGIMNYETVNFQLIENPAIESENYDKSLTNSADTILVIINILDEIDKIQILLDKAQAKKIIVFNNKNKLDERKIKATLESKKYNFVIINLKENKDLGELKNKIFQTFDKIRIYTKEPGKEKSKKPIIMQPNSTVKEAAEKILHGFSKTITQTKIWGPSSKFPGQIVGLAHKLKDLDVVEFKTR